MPQHATLSLVDLAKAHVTGYNDGNWDAVRAASAPGIVYEELATQRKVQGISDLLDVWRGWKTAFPDSKGTIQKEHTAGNTIVLELTWQGTHAGPLPMPSGEIPPTGKRINVRACEVIEVAGDKVKSVRHYFDLATLFQQLGVSR